MKINLSIHVELNISYTSKRIKWDARRDGRDDLVTSQYCAREKWRDLVRERSTTK